MGSTEEDNKEDTNEPVQTLFKPATTKEASVITTAVKPEWASELVEYLENKTLPSDKKKAIQLWMKATRSTMVNGTLYKRGYMLPLLKCVSKEEGDYILNEIQEGVCGSHSGARVLAHKAVRAGLYWPNMSWDSMKTIRTCNNCQQFANIPKQPPEELSSISSPLAFLSIWGRHSRTVTKRKRGVRFAVVVANYFTKWVEVKALMNIIAKSIERFLWRNII